MPTTRKSAASKKKAAEKKKPATKKATKKEEKVEVEEKLEKVTIEEKPQKKTEKEEKTKETEKKAAKSHKRKAEAEEEPKAKKQKTEPAEEEEEEEAAPKSKLIAEPELAPIVDVMVWGSGEVGQLGLGTTTLGRKRPALVPQLASKRVLKLEVGGLHNAVLVQTNVNDPSVTTLWTWGCNDNKILGRSTPVQEDESVDLSMVPDTVPDLEGKHIIDVRTGEYHMVALTNAGKLYSWGTFKDNEGFLGYSSDQRTEQEVPQIFPGLENRIIKQVASAHNHTIALTSNGEVLIWGFHWLGRKVSDRLKRTYLSPQPIAFHKRGKHGKEPKIVQVAAGGYQSFALSKEGVVYAWGLNNHGQLGLGHTKDVGAPTVVPELEGKGIVHIAAGFHHTLVLSKDGKVYSMGKGEYGQLGTGSTDASHTPKEIKFFSELNDKVIQISSIDNHCTAVTESGALYAWGFGDRGQIGNATADDEGHDENKPFKVEGPQIKGRKIAFAGAGGQHTALLAFPKEEESSSSTTTTTTTTTSK